MGRGEGLLQCLFDFLWRGWSSGQDLLSIPARAAPGTAVPWVSAPCHRWLALP